MNQQADDIVSLTLAVDRLADKVEGEKQARKTNNRWAVAVVVIFTLVLVVVGVVLVREHNQAQAIIDTRTASRILSCQDANQIAQKHNDLTSGVEDTLRTAAANGNRTPEQQAQIDAFLKAQISHYETIKIPLRDCSPEGVAEFWSAKNLTTTTTEATP